MTSVATTVAWLTARELLGRRRFLLLLPLPALLLVLAMLARSAGVDASQWAEPVLVGLGLAVVLPVISLIAGTSVLGSGIDDGTVVHILTKPLPRRQIVLPKLAVAAGVTSLAAAVPLGLTGMVADSVRLGVALLVAGVLGAVTYSALFLALSLVSRRPVLVGLAYVLIWEDTLGNIVAGARSLSIQQYVVTLADRLAPTDLLDGAVAVPFALVVSVLVIGAATGLAVRRLRVLSIAGETS